MTVRLVLGLLFTVVALAVAGRRVWWLSRLIRTGQPAPGRLDGVRQRAAGRGGRGLRPAQAAEVVGPGRRALLHVLGVRRPGRDDPRGLRRAVRPGLPIPLIGHWRAARASSRTSSRSPCWLASATFAVIRLRQAPAATAARVPVLRLAHRRRLARCSVMIFNWSIMDAAALPRRADQHRRLPVRTTAGGRSPPGRVAKVAGTRWARRQRGRSRPSASCCADRRDARLPGASSSTPSTCTSSWRRSTSLTKREPDGAGPAAADDGRRQADRLRGRRELDEDTSSAAARSRTSPGRACSTSRPAPSAAAASRSARPGTPASRCRPSS